MCETSEKTSVVKMEAKTQRESLDYCLVAITNPLNKQVDDSSVQELLAAIKDTSDGSQIALQFLSHKIQSPQEIEAVQALNVLDSLVQKGDSSIIVEIGKFRFLNELIKVVSPKYLAYRSTPKVKQFVIELIFKWTVDFRNETKISEAYQMLKKQGIVFSDPIHVLPDREITPPPPRRKDEIFSDDENSKILHRLLQSKNPEDLQAANKLIKMMVKEADKKMSLKARCSTELEIVCNNAKVLSEMLMRYIPGETTEEELELVKELHDSCVSLRPKLFRLAAEIDEKDPELNEILHANDELTKVINEYKVKMGISTGVPSLQNEQNLLDLSSPIQQKANDVSLVDLNIDPKDYNNHTQNNGNVDTRNSDNDLSAILAIKTSCNGSSSTQNALLSTSPRKVVSQKQNNDMRKSCLDELEEIMRKTVTTEKKTENLSDKTPLNQLKISPKTINQCNLSASDSSESTSMPPPLCDVFVPLESVEPTSVAPLHLMDKNGIKVILNFGKGCPRKDVTVMVITIMNTNKTAVSQINFQAAVPKTMRVKLQPASSTSLPAFNPFLPPFAITQVMLAARNSWDSDKVRFKYRITYVIEEKSYTEVGEIEHLFSTINL